MAYVKGIHPFSVQAAGTVLNVGEAGAADRQFTVYLIDIQNTTAAVAYLQIFNKRAADVTLGTTAPTYAFGVPASGHITIPMPEGLYLGGGGMSVAGTTTRTGSTGAAVDINVSYQ